MTDRTDYFEPLQCGLTRVVVDFERHAVTLHLPEMECTDMEGAIAYAKQLDPDVRVIDTIAGTHLDTRYSLTPDGWTAAL